MALACSACGWGEEDPISVQDVVEAFAAEEIELSELIGDHPNSVLRSSLGPADAPPACTEDLRVSIFRRDSDVEDLLRRGGPEPGKQRYTFSDEGAERVVGFVRGNVVASVAARSRCFAEARVSEAMSALD
jgi:hypothetical protein